MHAELSNHFPNMRSVDPEWVANAQKRDIQDLAVLKIEGVDLEGADA